MQMKRETWIKVGSWVLIILIAPFALEILFVAEVVGVDIAVAMLFLYLSSFRVAFRKRLDAATVLLAVALKKPTDRLQYFTRSYYWNIALSCVVVWITGSLLLSIMLWLPTFLLASQFS